MVLNNKIHRTEVEITLIICSNDPQEIACGIGEITQIANFKLFPQHPRKIHDIYLDTDCGALQKQKLSFRLREIDETFALTLKDRPQLNYWGGKERLEIEGFWSINTMLEIIKELEVRGVKVNPPYQDLIKVYPLETLHSLGLKIIQDRENYRKVRNVISLGEDNGKVLAELTVDSVVYHFNNQDVCHYEVEIEEKSKESSKVLKSISESLIEIYGPVLRKWTPGKYVTGKAIEKLLRNRSLEGLLNKNKLYPSAYNKLDEFLKYD